MDPAKSATAAPPVMADAASLPAGYRLMEYRVERMLGGGGFGITYLAHDDNLNTPVALKEYFPSELVSRVAGQTVEVRGGNAQVKDQYDWGLERFLDEARALATFRHPNIVRVLRYFRANSTAYIVMEYESGEPLKRWVPQQAPFGRKALLSIIYPLLDGLHAVHRTGFLHRDIKPDNIYVRADGTPVLLDFGAARRVTTNRDMTNIVSPGFAPFEQYHSQGNQGPWTDIYSLGAVMYWMTTGKKPVESASRVKADTMPKAAAIGDASIFGLELLQAIDQALQPDEANRPQDVAQFRNLIQAAEAASHRLDIELAHDRTGLPATAYAPAMPGSGRQPSAAASPTSGDRKNLLCTILFLDLVGYSIRSVDDQVALKTVFNELIGKAVKGVDESSRISIDTGDGAAICFMGDPEEALQSALLMRDLLAARHGQLSVRIGLHMGPVRIVTDINDRKNVLGDGINVAQRVMDFAQANQVLVSRAYYDVISRITDDRASLFEYLGPHQDKHGRQHEVYGVVSTTHEKTRLAGGPATGYTRTLPVQSIQALDPAVVASIETELARHIGPLAKVLVNKAKGLAGDVHSLREALAPSIPDAKTRQSFLFGPSGNSGRHSRPNSAPPSSLSQPMPSGFGESRSMPLSQPLSRPHSQPYGQPMSQPLSRPYSQPQGNTGLAGDGATQRALDISAEELALVEKAMSKYIGPMAKMLVRKEAQRHVLYGSFINGVASNIDQPTQRAEFLAAIKRALPHR